MMDPPSEYTSSEKHKGLRRCDRPEETQDSLQLNVVQGAWVDSQKGEAQQWENRGSLRKSQQFS